MTTQTQRVSKIIFLNNKETEAINFLITALEDAGLTINSPRIEGEGKSDIQGIRWVAVDNNHPSVHILLTKWGKKFKLIVNYPSNLECMDSYVIVHNHCLIFPNGRGKLDLNKIDSGIFMSLPEIRDYLR